MELPQPCPIGTEGKKPTHDFLSLYTHSSFQDPRPSQGNFLRTHDFLQPLERVGKNSTTAEKTIEKNDIEKPPPPSTSSSTSVEHILPGGIGTYTIRHISNFNQRAPKTEQSVYALVRPEKSNEVIKPNSSSNCVGARAFTIWEESTSKEKGATAKHPPVERQVIKETAGENLGHWSTDRPLQTPPFVHRNTTTTTTTTTNNSNSNSSSFNCRSSSKTKNQSFMEMMKSGRGLQEDEDDDDDEFLSKKSHSSSNNKEGKSGEQRANTPRSKHSATEQRRRSKINDRFQILRDLIPQNDQKRDKASFLLEVIDYIKYLQEKVNRYETSYQGWNQEPTKLTPWRNGHAPVDTIVDPSQAINSVPVPTLVFSGKFDDNNIPANPTMLIGAQNPVEPDLSTSSAIKAIEQHAGLASKGVPIPIPAHTVPPFGRNCGLAQAPQQPMSDSENMASQPPSHLWQGVLCADECPMTSDALNEQEELTIEGGTISIAGAYSQGLLNNLTQALQSSGVDLSQASISVQVDIGKRAINRLTTMASGAAKDHEDPGSERAMTHSRFGSSGEDSDHARKRPRIE